MCLSAFSCQLFTTIDSQKQAYEAEINKLKKQSSGEQEDLVFFSSLVPSAEIAFLGSTSEG